MPYDNQNNIKTLCETEVHAPGADVMQWHIILTAGPSPSRHDSILQTQNIYKILVEYLKIVEISYGSLLEVLRYILLAGEIP